MDQTTLPSINEATKNSISTSALFLPRAWQASVLVLFFLALQVLFHAADMRIWSVDNNSTLRVTFDLVDHGKFPLVGMPLAGEPELRNSGINLGPLANLLLAFPAYLSGNVYWQYYTYSAFNLIAILLFWYSCRRLYPKGPFALIATIAFGSQPMMVPFSPETMFYIPLFLALLFYSLVRISQGGRLWIPMMYFVFGLCIQLHLTVLFLLPALVYTTLHHYRSRSFWRLTLLGLILLVSTHITVLVSMFLHFDPEAFRTALVYVAGHPGKGSILNIMGWLMIAGPLWLGLAASLYAVLCLFLSRRISNDLPENRRLYFSAWIATITFLLIAPPMLKSKNMTLLYYLWPLAAHWAMLAGLYFQRLYQKGIHKSLVLHITVFISLTIITVVGLLIFMPICQKHENCDTSLGSFRLNDQVFVADQLALTIRKLDLHDVEIHDVRYHISNGSLHQAWDNSDTYDVLVGYRDPELKNRISITGKSKLWVVTWPSRENLDQALEPGQLVERWHRGCCMDTAIFAKRN